MCMNIITWLIIGGFIGLIINLIIKNSHRLYEDIILGIIGGFIGGIIINQLENSNIVRFSPFVLLILLISVTLCILIGRIFHIPHAQ